jgi:hypothetical protein
LLLPSQGMHFSVLGGTTHVIEPPDVGLVAILTAHAHASFESEMERKDSTGTRINEAISSVLTAPFQSPAPFS